MMVRDKYREFQQAAFVMGYGSNKQARDFRDVLTLLNDFDNRQHAELKGKLTWDFFQSYNFIQHFLQQRTLAQWEFPSINSYEDMVSVVQMLCKKWKQLTQARLYYRKGLHYAIGQLRAAL